MRAAAIPARAPSGGGCTDPHGVAHLCWAYTTRSSPPAARSSPPAAGRSLVAAATVLVLGLLPRPSIAQVPVSVEIRDGAGQALVRNPSLKDIRVEVALWDSDESGDRVRLLRESRASLWPTAFELAPGESQVVRILVEDGIHPVGTLLRLETRLIPVEPAPEAEGEGATARITLVTRVLSKVHIR